MSLRDSSISSHFVKGDLQRSWGSVATRKKQQVLRLVAQRRIAVVAWVTFSVCSVFFCCISSCIFISLGNYTHVTLCDYEAQKQAPPPSFVLT